jgi:predicted transposase YbfD/YdcC
MAHLPEDVLLQWSKCETIARVQSEVERDGKTVREDRFYISTLLAAKVDVVGMSVRSHWNIENRLHWTLDVAFREDGIRTRKGNAAECGAVLRHLVVNLLNRDPNPKGRSIKARRQRAGRVPEYRLAALLGFPENCQIAEPERNKGYVAIKPGNSAIHPLLRLGSPRRDGAVGTCLGNQGQPSSAGLARIPATWAMHWMPVVVRQPPPSGRWARPEYLRLRCG